VGQLPLNTIGPQKGSLRFFERLKLVEAVEWVAVTSSRAFIHAGQVFPLLAPGSTARLDPQESFALHNCFISTLGLND
jgi:hypothetical protein